MLAFPDVSARRQPCHERWNRAPASAREEPRLRAAMACSRGPMPESPLDVRALGHVLLVHVIAFWPDLSLDRCP